MTDPAKVRELTIARKRLARERKDAGLAVFRNVLPLDDVRLMLECRGYLDELDEDYQVRAALQQFLVDLVAGRVPE
jgi:hypothetical protein